MSLFPRNFVYHYCCFRCMESTSYVSPFRIVFFYFVATAGYIFYIRLCDKSTNQSINGSNYCMKIVLLRKIFFNPYVQ